MLSDVHFDYLAVTFAPRAGKSAPLFIAGWLSKILREDYKEASYGLRNYSTRLVFPVSDVLLLYGGETQKDTVHVIVSGAGCRILGISGIKELGSYFSADYHLRVTRLDVAVDVSGTKYLSAWADIKSCVLSPYVRKYKEVSERSISTDDVMSRTVYVGSRQSLRMLRIYGKSTDEGELYTRVELEVKSAPALELFSEFVSGRIDIYGVAVSAFAGFFDVELFLQTKINGLSVPVSFSDRKKMKNTIVWALSNAGAWVALWDYYGKSNVDAMVLEAAALKELRKKSKSRKKLPVGNTGVTNFSFDIECKTDEILSFMYPDPGK